MTLTFHDEERARQFWQERLAELEPVVPKNRGPVRRVRRARKGLTWQSFGRDEHDRVVVTVTGPTAYRRVDYLPPAVFADERLFRAWVGHHVAQYWPRRS